METLSGQETVATTSKKNKSFFDQFMTKEKDLHLATNGMKSC